MHALHLPCATLLVLLFVTAACQDVEWVHGLLQLYDALGGRAWLHQSGWASDTGEPPCRWYGVSCGTEGQLTGLMLARNNLAGTIPAAFFSREVGADLVYMNVSGNSISGTLPEHLFVAFDKLVTLDASFNSFSGPIPTSLSASGSMRELVLRRNMFSGWAPELSGANAALSVMDLGQNRLTGPFPQSYAQAAQRLHTLLLDENFLADSPSSVFSAGSGQKSSWRSSLAHLDLSNNYLIGSLPSDIGRFRSLRVLKMDGNRIYGAIPYEISNLSRIEELSLAHNYLRGSIPCSEDAMSLAAPASSAGSLSAFRWFAGPDRTPLPSLVFLDLSDNDLEGEACEVDPESNLRTLRLADNSFSGILPKIAGLKLTEVTLGGANKWVCDLPRPEEVPGWVDLPPSTTCIDSSLHDGYPAHQLPANRDDVFIFTIVLVACVAAPFVLALLEASGVLLLSSAYRLVLSSGLVRWAGSMLEYETSDSDGEERRSPDGSAGN